MVKKEKSVDGAQKDSSVKLRGLGPLTTDTPSELDILGHDCDTLGVDGAQVGVLEKPDQVSLGSLLQ
jgi:hypothetical protein